MKNMRKSRAKQGIDYDAIFKEALDVDGWVEVAPVAHLTREQFVEELKRKANARKLVCEAMWAKNGWIMILVTRKPELT